MGDKQDKETAHHEAAHAVADVRFDFAPTMVSIEPEGETLGLAGQVYGYTGFEWEDQTTGGNYIVSLLAGYVAEIECGADQQAARCGSTGDQEPPPSKPHSHTPRPRVPEGNPGLGRKTLTRLGAQSTLVPAVIRFTAMPKHQEKVRVVARLPVELVLRVDRYAVALGQRVAGVPFTRTDALKALLTAGLEREQPPQESPMT